MVQAASYPPLQRTQERGTHSSGTGKSIRKVGYLTSYREYARGEQRPVLVNESRKAEMRLWQIA